MILLSDPKLGRDFLISNCVLYPIGLVLSLKEPNRVCRKPWPLHPFQSRGSRIYGVADWADCSFHPIYCAPCTTAFPATGPIFGLVWSTALDKSQFTSQHCGKALDLYQSGHACGLIAYSWINRDKESGEEGLSILPIRRC